MNDAKRRKLERINTRVTTAVPASEVQKTLRKSPIKSSASIGVYLQRFETKEPFCASDRIRGEWIAKNSNGVMEIFDPRKQYNVVIFHVACAAIAQYGKIKILDICDKVWERNPEEFKEFIKPIHAFIVPTEDLKKELSAIVTDKPIHVITDGHDFMHYQNTITNNHTDIAKQVVWFGYAENAGCLEPFINHIKTLGIKLKVICQNQNTFPLKHADSFVKFDVNTYVNEISKADFALLPPNQSYKSNNKDISALLCGIPVAKTIEDVDRFMNPEERQLEITRRWKELPQYSIRLRVAEYLHIIDSLSIVEQNDAGKVVVNAPITNADIQVYSSICGKFDPERNDIKVFADSDYDKFKLPVMNAKIYKILSHKFFSSKFTIYVDGNIVVLNEPSDIIQQLLKNADMALFKHPFRNCLYDEMEHAIKRVEEQFKPLMTQQVADYRKEGMPANFGLGECGMLIRRNNPIVNEFNERWWAEICRYTNRDQMSFPYVLWKMRGRLKVNFIDGNVRDNAAFKYTNH